jgi:ribosomal protein L6P/L9E
VRAVTAKVLNGKVVTRARLPEGAKLTVFVHEPDVDVELDGEDEAAIAAGAAEIRAGRYVSANELRSFLRRK